MRQRLGCPAACGVGALPPFHCKIMRLLHYSKVLNGSECNAEVMPQKIRMALRPEGSFEVPFSDGYQLYSALLGAMKEFDYAIAGHTHDSPIGSISLGPLEGRFLPGKRE